MTPVVMVRLESLETQVGAHEFKTWYTRSPSRFKILRKGLVMSDIRFNSEY